MISIKNLFRHGPGPSSAYSIHPYRVAKEFKDECHDATTIRVTLYGDLAINSIDNFSEQALKSAISPLVARITTDSEFPVPDGTVAAKFQAYGKKKTLQREEIFYFNKLGEISEMENSTLEEITSVDLLEWTYENGRAVWEFALKHDTSNLEEYLKVKWDLMKKSIENGLKVEGGLPGDDSRKRRASLFLARSLKNRDFIQQISKTLSYSLAISEESASAKTIVAAPTAKSAGIIPSVLSTLIEIYKVSEVRIIRGLITAGFIGKLLYKQILSGNTFSDITIATSMASAAATQIMGGTPKQVIAAAAIGLNSLKLDALNSKYSHMDYIELNALGAAKAVDNATWALLSDNNLTKEIEFFNKLTKQNLETIKS